MPRPVASSLTDHELSIMQILWEESHLTVAEILERFPKKPKPAYNSLLTGVRALEKKGVVAHRKDATRAYRYSPVLQETIYKRSALKRLVSGVFGGNAFEVAVNLLKSEALNDAELAQLRELLEKR